MRTTVVNKRTHVPTANDVYIGRPSKWGNPFIIGVHGTREEVIRAHKRWILAPEQAALLEQVKELKGKTLVCYCRPDFCHGDILSELAEES